MVGTALSAITFLSVPGSVRSDGWTYMQVVGGYFVGYVGIAYGILPLYYRYARASVYEYFRYQLGPAAEKTAAIFFLLSRSIGSSLRLFLALWVLSKFFSAVPFELLSAGALLLILLYTFRGGIATLIYTDFFQTTLFLGTAVFTAWHVAAYMPDASKWPTIIETNPAAPHFWVRDFLAGVLIALSMTGLDQDQMQKSLSLPSVQAARKNLLLYGALLFPVNFLFLFLGSLLWEYAKQQGIQVPPDELFVQIVLREGEFLQGLFVLGVSAAALSSADGSLTALTTATLRNLLPRQYETIGIKNIILLAWTILFWFFMIGYTFLPQEGHILGRFLRFSGYTYGPLLGLFIFSRIVPTGEYRFVGWALPALLGAALAGEWLVGGLSGYLSILWTGGIALLGLLGITLVSRR